MSPDKTPTGQKRDGLTRKIIWAYSFGLFLPNAASSFWLTSGLYYIETVVQLSPTVTSDLMLFA